MTVWTVLHYDPITRDNCVMIIGNKNEGLSFIRKITLALLIGSHDYKGTTFPLFASVAETVWCYF